VGAQTSEIYREAKNKETKIETPEQHFASEISLLFVYMKPIVNQIKLFIIFKKPKQNSYQVLRLMDFKDFPQDYI